jgi:hypothetical protein
MTDSLQELLAELLSESRERTIERTSEAYDRLAHPFGRRVVIFGTGQLGRFVLPAARRAGLGPLAFCDNNPSRWGTEIEREVGDPHLQAALNRSCPPSVTAWLRRIRGDVHVGETNNRRQTAGELHRCPRPLPGNGLAGWRQPTAHLCLHRRPCAKLIETPAAHLRLREADFW